MSDPFLGEIKIISWNYAPKGWAFCNGQLLPINQNQALFSLFGTMYGGDGRVNFALPDFRGKVPIHVGAGFIQGQVGGETAHTLAINELTMHIHFLQASTQAANAPVPFGPSGNILATSGTNLIYAQPSNLVAMNAGSVTSTGGSQAHDNMQPYLVLNFIVALQGIFPSRN